MKWSLYILVGISFLLFNCTKPGVYRQLSGITQGTTYSIIYKEKDTTDYQQEIENILAEVESTFSLYDSTSLISQINESAQPIEMNDLMLETYKISSKVWKETDGAYDITVGTLVNAWGFGPQKMRLPDSATIDSILQFTGFEKVKLENRYLIRSDPRLKINFNAIADGYAVDLVSRYLESKDIHHYLVEIGGEVKANGKNTKGLNWKVGIDKPVDSNEEPGSEIYSVVELNNSSLSTSGNYRRFFIENGVKYSHTIDPKTGYPARNRLLSATVLHKECGYADALSTAFMVLGIEKSKELIKSLNIEAYLIYNNSEGNFEIFKTKGIKVLDLPNGE